MNRIVLNALIVGLLAAGAAPSRAAAPAAAPGYAVTKRIVIGGEGGWDCLTVDGAAHRLYLSHSTRVEVVDTIGDTLVGEIRNTSGVHAIALAPELGRGFTSNGRDSTVTIFDLKSLATLGTVHVRGRNPDLIVFDPATRRVFTMNAGSHTTTAIDAATGTVIDTLQLGGQPEFAVADGRGRIYVNLEDKSAIVSFDARTLKLGPSRPLAPGEEPTGLAWDAAHRRLIAGCANKLMVVMDADSGHIVGTAPVGEGVDGAAFDPGLRLAFTPNGEGSLTVVHETGPGRYGVVETAPTQKGGRTMALDATTHRIYIPTAEYGPPPAPTAERPHPRPSIVPGTFTVLVLEPQAVAVHAH